MATDTNGLFTEAQFSDDLTAPPLWPLSSYAPGRYLPGQLLEGTDWSPEEIRVQYYLGIANNAIAATHQQVQGLIVKAREKQQIIASHTKEATQYINLMQNLKYDKYNSTHTSAKPPTFFEYLATTKSTSGLGQPSSAAPHVKSAFSGSSISTPASNIIPNNSTSHQTVFSKPSAFASSSQPSTLSQHPVPSAFGPARLQLPSSQPTGSTFGSVSPSAFRIAPQMINPITQKTAAISDPNLDIISKVAAKEGVKADYIKAEYVGSEEIQLNHLTNGRFVPPCLRGNVYEDRETWRHVWETWPTDEELLSEPDYVTHLVSQVVTEDERQQFSAQEFTPGQIPLKAPPEDISITRK